MATKARKARRLRRQAILGFAGLATIAVLLFGVFPTRTYLQQRHELSLAKQQLDLLEKTNSQLQDQSNKLQTDAEIERIAREKYNLVKPGEQVYGLLPSASRVAPVPAPIVVHKLQKSLWARFLDSVEFWR